MFKDIRSRLKGTFRTRGTHRAVKDPYHPQAGVNMQFICRLICLVENSYAFCDFEIQVIRNYILFFIP